MGKYLLILMFGLSISSGIIVLNKNRQLLDSNQLAVEHFSNSSARNAANSGVYIALNHLYLDGSWRPNYGSPLVLNSDTISISVQDTLVPANQLKIISAGENDDVQASSEVMVFDGNFHDFAVWAKDSVENVTARDSIGVVDTSLVVEYAPFMPYIDFDNLKSVAISQGHNPPPDGNGHFHPPFDGYPGTGSFYNSGSIPNVIYVDSNLHIKDPITVYGIFIVEGDTFFDENVTVEGVICMPNTGTLIYNNKSDDSQINGGIVTWGGVNGNGYQVYVDHDPEYMRALASNYAPNNPRLRVLSWK
jgi:hypothetical protein